MSWIKRFGHRLAALRDAAKREFLRDPTVLLFERAPGAQGDAARDAAGGR
ncbi:hypothetical protein KFK14_23195 [Sphingobium phenoxybenzoativorans]|uniref:Uncharacterized protein n=1 Tax=Sphingobium phenoxybenzoativorans TaxID=1592790 RepID=A0A975K6P4_9SPHN|nr:hypothetical protein [Sphingobium phenoxybenzoativorans]QUT05805.1 hypothetical protein KFK14_23195 [Sphingobium phenoxybenzoativorans]